MAVLRSIACLCVLTSVSSAGTDWVTVIPPGETYRYVMSGTPAGWEQPWFDDSAWAIGRAPFSNVTTGDFAYETYWPSPEDPLLRVKFYLPAKTTLRVSIGVDNGFDLWINGQWVAGEWEHGPAVRWEYVFEIPQDLTVVGENLIAVGLDDQGHQTGFDMLVEAMKEWPIVFHVNAAAPDGGGGLSWDTALNDLQSALQLATRLDEIWVASGSYTPSSAGDRAATFQLRAGVSVIGHFAGHESSPDERDLEDQGLTTFLTGDLAGDDSDGFLDYSDNSFHVVTVSPGSDDQAVLSGLTIQAGNSSDHPDGSPFSGGAAIFADGANLAMVDCIVESNLAGAGGGAVLGIDSTLLIDRCTFRWNSGVLGGALTTTSGSGRVTRSEFLRNVAATGGAVYNNVPLLVDNSLFVANEADPGTGGAVCTGSPTGELRLLNCTIVQNAAQELGGGIFARTSSPAVHVTNSVLWGNWDANGTGEGGQLTFANVDAPPLMDWNCLQGWTGNLGGVGNTGSDPSFADELGPDGQPWTGDEDHRLDDLSPCIDAADSSALPPDVELDLDGNPRFYDDQTVPDSGNPGDVGVVVDMGSYEFVRDSAPCPGDLSGDLVVDLVDLGILLAWYHEGDGGDLNGDGLTDLTDLGFLLAQFGEPCR
jgi:hypothetical protein